MAIVKEGIASTGARYRIMDDDYAGIDPEENARRIAYACEVAHRILVDYARRQEERKVEQKKG